MLSARKEMAPASASEREGLARCVGSKTRREASMGLRRTRALSRGALHDPTSFPGLHRSPDTVVRTSRTSRRDRISCGIWHRSHFLHRAVARVKAEAAGQRHSRHPGDVQKKRPRVPEAVRLTVRKRPSVFLEISVSSELDGIEG